MDPVVLLFGLGVGVLVGTTGIGGLDHDPTADPGAGHETRGRDRHRSGVRGDHEDGRRLAPLLCGAATLARAMLVDGSRTETDEPVMDARPRAAAVAIGVSVGFVLGVTSAGSGALIAVGLILVIVLITASFGLVLKAGAPVPVATVLALPAVLGLAAFINSRRTRRERVRLAEIAA